MTKPCTWRFAAPAVAAAMAVASATCGGAKAPVSSSCQVTLAGAVVGAWDCRPATTHWYSSENQGWFKAYVTNKDVFIDLGVVFAGEPQAGTFQSSYSSGLPGGISIQTGSFVNGTNKDWTAGSFGTSKTVGSWTLNFTSVSSPAAESTGRIYDGEGTLDATLVSLTDAGPITLHATF